MRLAQWYMVSCTENLSKLYIFSGCRTQVRDDLQLPAFMNQTNFVNCGVKQMPKAQLCNYLYAYIQFCDFYHNFHPLLLTGLSTRMHIYSATFSSSPLPRPTIGFTLYSTLCSLHFLISVILLNLLP